MNGLTNILRGQGNSRQTATSAPQNTASASLNAATALQSAAPAPHTQTPTQQTTYSNGGQSSNTAPQESRRNTHGQIAWRTNQLCLGGGVAIFHLATERVVVCRHGREGYWFLPKGRRDPNEDSRVGAEREGFEESGYRNRVLPIPIPHSQPRPHNVSGPQSPDVTEPILTELLPFRRDLSYLLSWFVAETLPDEAEEWANNTMWERATEGNPTPYVSPPSFPAGMTLLQRIAQDRAVAANENDLNEVPLRHDGTGVDSDEAQYESYLLKIDEALEVLRGTSMEYVVRFGWECIGNRHRREQGGGGAASVMQQ